MPQSLANALLHIVFPTKELNRNKSIIDAFRFKMSSGSF